jgi:lipopolysaccharide/colanic/teichoic acid biosynthesis glycosyltransferase
MTGLWQVSGRSDLDFDDMARLDLQYIETWSLKSDLRIVWRTAGAVARSRGAH